ncbi:spore germination protein [Bacillus mesophilus]|uniref:Ger(X)C family spore germination protein n=1 Tax=Bacillus mesophilus TaxID=1808955 RepID=A0A6M0QBC8_9BACI|nr:Ger(x)C family spore germination protein [Bacillus mesophilus]MBM7662973.1 spore germination protein [Bacillus mesophilus]NEY73701.1 Ger(x)C family spore germination protein [Bacillus mesophilus]
MRKIKILTILLILLMNSGCWDSIEIEQRGFVIGVGIDLAEKKGEEGDKLLKLTQQFVVPAAMSGSGSSSGEGTQEAYQNIESVGNTIFEMVRTVAAQTSRSPFYEHIKLIVISEEVAKSEKFPDVIDFFLRYPEMRRGIQVMITPDSAKDILEFKPGNEKLPSMFIQSISRNNYKNARMVPPTRIGDLHGHLLGTESFMIQMVSKLSKEEVKLTGHAVINGKSDQLVGFIREDATEGANFLTGEIKGGLLEAELGGEVIIFQINEVKTQIKPIVSSKEDIKFKINISTTGSIPESFAPINLLEQKDIKQIEKAVEEKIRYFVGLAIDEVQKEMKTDVLGFGRAIMVQESKHWEKLKDNWDFGENYFSKSEIDLSIDVTVSRNGAIIKSSLE